jgi:two-component system, OmpR family, sensor histidine kinase KdpD
VSAETARAPAAGHRAVSDRAAALAGGTASQAEEAGGAGQHGSARRGRLRVYLGVAPGAGTTCTLLSEGHRRAQRGEDVVVAAVQTHGRPGTARLLEGLEIIPPATVACQGTVAEKMDLGAVLARRPQVALLDKLAHGNPPGPGHATRWQDAWELLAVGIDVISTVSIGHLDSVTDVMEKITGISPTETVPDQVVRAADEIELVDLAPETLRERMARGDIYPPEQAEAALAGWFRIGTLSAVRELALLWLAATLARDPRRYRPGGHPHDSWQARERVVVALAGGPEGQALIRRAARIAARCGADLMAVHVTRPGGRARAAAAALTAQRQLTETIGGTYHELIDNDIPAALLTFAHTDGATQLVLGTRHRSWLSALRRKTRIASRVIHGSSGTDVHIITHSHHVPPNSTRTQATQSLASSRPTPDDAPGVTLGDRGPDSSGGAHGHCGRSIKRLRSQA